MNSMNEEKVMHIALPTNEFKAMIANRTVRVSRKAIEAKLLENRKTALESKMVNEKPDVVITGATTATDTTEASLPLEGMNVNMTPPIVTEGIPKTEEVKEQTVVPPVDVQPIAAEPIPVTPETSVVPPIVPEEQKIEVPVQAPQTEYIPPVSTFIPPVTPIVETQKVVEQKGQMISFDEMKRVMQEGILPALDNVQVLEDKIVKLEKENDKYKEAIATISSTINNGTINIQGEEQPKILEKAA